MQVYDFPILASDQEILIRLTGYTSLPTADLSDYGVRFADLVFHAFNSHTANSLYTKLTALRELLSSPKPLNDPSRPRLRTTSEALSGLEREIFPSNTGIKRVRIADPLHSLSGKDGDIIFAEGDDLYLWIEGAAHRISMHDIALIPEDPPVRRVDRVAYKKSYSTTTNEPF
jgi:hypothetical protein